MTPIDLKVYNIIDGQRLFFEFESGITVEGLNITGIRDVKGKIQIIKLEDCTVKYGDKILLNLNMVFTIWLLEAVLSLRFLELLTQSLLKTCIVFQKLKP